MEITIKIKNENELKRIRKILKGEKINVLLNSSKRKKNIPNKETIETFHKTDEGEELIVCKDVNDFYKKLGI